jgi:hypothetical protein
MWKPFRSFCAFFWANDSAKVNGFLGGFGGFSYLGEGIISELADYLRWVIGCCGCSA